MLDSSDDLKCFSILNVKCNTFFDQARNLGDTSTLFGSRFERNEWYLLGSILNRWLLLGSSLG